MNAIYLPCGCKGVIGMTIKSLQVTTPCLMHHLQINKEIDEE